MGGAQGPTLLINLCPIALTVGLFFCGRAVRDSTLVACGASAALSNRWLMFDLPPENADQIVGAREPGTVSKSQTMTLGFMQVKV